MCQRLFNVIFYSGFLVSFDIWNKIREKIFFFSDFIPYIKADKKTILEYRIQKFITHPSESQHPFRIVTLNLHKVLLKNNQNQGSFFRSK